jgi:hypothetical protein
MGLNKIEGKDETKLRLGDGTMDMILTMESSWDIDVGNEVLVTNLTKYGIW